ncbi:TonB-dependent receptor [Brevundimonas sp.]|uniref:TonB-dependent receptor n=1 Tax=Brevundimonas sp. TaxID=1871086 RepID=UPI0027378DAF|nr:TonB-dependent receptor [Brevundimonas sp.]
MTRALRRNLFAGASGLVLALSVGVAAAAAQTPPQEDAAEIDEVVVTGFRSSLAQALNVKRREAGAVDVIMAEDIADFPDQNLAEAIQRIPGVAITRDAGEGRNISVRGLGPDFTRIRINGMEALGTTGGTDSSGGTNRGRGFDFNVFASDLFNSIMVRKTASADTEEGSLGATVDLRAARPFDYPGFTVAVSGQMGWNDLAQNPDPRAAFLISNTWGDGTFGALLSVAYSGREALEEGHSTVRWQGGNVGSGPGAVNAFTPRLPRYGILEHDQERLGITGSLQWRPTARTEVSLDLLYADFSATRFEHFLQAPDFSAGGAGGRAGIVVVDSEVDGNGNMVYGVFDNVDVRSESRFDELTTEFTQLTLDVSHEFSDTFRVNAFLGSSTSEHDNPIQTTLLFDHASSDGYSYDYRDNANLPLITYGFDVNDPANWTLSQIRLRPQTADNTYETAQLSGEWDARPGVTFSGGLFFKTYTFETTELRRDPASCGLAPTGNAEGCIPAGVAGTPITDFSRIVGLADQWDIPAGSTLSWLIPDYHAADALFDFGSFPMSFIPSRGNNRSVEEESQGAYVQVDFDAELGSIPVRGNYGLRYIKTDQYSTGYTLAAGAPVFTSASRSYDDLLPSMNLVFEPGEDFLIRFGAAKVMTRPGLGSLTPGGTVSVSGNNRTVNSGNPMLEPTRATTYDLAFEWYFAPESILSLALFRKEINSFVANDTVTQPFTGNSLGLPDSVATAACGAVPGCSPSADWVFNQPVNTDGGDLDGYEISYQQPLTFLPGFLGNLGVLANYTYVDSQIEYPNGTTNTLTNLSKRAYNATLYYEDDRFSARVSGTYRDGYLTQVPGRNGNAIEGVVDTFNVDASASYNVTDQLTLTLEGINLTDEVPTQYVGIYNLVSVHHHTGRQFFAGFRYSF